MKIIHAFIFSAVPLCAAACSAAPPEGEPVGAGGESTGKAEQPLDPVCYEACTKGCACLEDDRLCQRNCSRTCFRQCTFFCFPSCAGQACGASDGCGGTCATGSCPSGAVCGAGGTPGQCTFLPDLVPSIAGTLQFVGFNAKRGVYTLRIRNLGAADANNVKISMQTNLPAGLLSLTPSNGFACYLPSGFFPRLGLECVGGHVAANDEAVIQLTTSLSVSGANVLSVIADPDNTIAELFEGADNLANVTLFVP